MVIPFIKGVAEKEWHLTHNYFRHVGMYAYRKDVLEKITQLTSIISGKGRITGTTPLGGTWLQRKMCNYKI